MPGKPIVTTDHIVGQIHTVRGHKVMLDSALAALYGVSVKRLNEQVKRNAGRFPSEFMFQLTASEFETLRSQIATLKVGRGQHRKYLPHVFTEHGAIMLTTVLNSAVAVEISVQVVRAFVQMRRLVGTVAVLSRKLESLEQRLVKHDEHFAVVFQAIRQLMAEPHEEEPKKRLGFQPPQRKSKS